MTISPTLHFGRETVVRSALWRLVDSIGLELFSFVFFIVLSRLLTPAVFGVVTIAGVFTQACQVILRSGFGAAITQRAELEPAHLTAALWGNLGISAICAAGLVLLAWPISVAQDKAPLLPVMTALAPILLLTSVSWIYHAAFKRDLRYDICALSGLVSVFGGGLTGIVLALSGAGVWSLVGQQLAGAGAALVILVVCSPWRPSLGVSRRHLRELAGFANRVAMGDVLDFVGRRMDAPILGFFLSTHAIGLYFIATRLTFTVGMLTYFIIYDLCLAILSRLQSSPQALREGASMTLRLTTLFSLPTSIGLGLVAEPLISLLFGADWIEGALPLQLMCAFSTAFALTLNVRQILNVAGRPLLGLWLAGINAILSLVALTLAAPLGLAAAALSGGLAYTLCLPVAILFLNRTLGTNTRRLVRDQLPIWLATAIMAIVVMGSARIEYLESIADHPLAMIGLKSILGAATFIVSLRLTAPFLFFQVVSLGGGSAKITGVR